MMKGTLYMPIYFQSEIKFNILNINKLTCYIHYIYMNIFHSIESFSIFRPHNFCLVHHMHANASLNPIRTLQLGSVTHRHFFILLLCWRHLQLWLHRQHVHRPFFEWQIRLSFIIIIILKKAYIVYIVLFIRDHILKHAFVA